MEQPFVLTEEELHRRSLCSLYAPPPVDPMSLVAEEAFRWALHERHLHRLPTPEDLRAKFVALWAGSRSDAEKDLAYWEGPKTCAAFARRVYMFLLRYEVLHPYQPYTLEVDGGLIQGQNAVVLWPKARQEPVPMVVDLRIRRPRDLRVPFYPGLAQWQAARMDVETVDLGIVHLPLLWGEPWCTKEVNERLTRHWLTSILNEAVEQRVFPRVGPQCRNCAHPCKDVFHAPGGRSARARDVLYSL